MGTTETLSRYLLEHFWDTKKMQTKVEKHFNQVAKTYDEGKYKYAFYYSTIKKLLQNLIGYKKSVLEIGCGTGDLLASLKPRVGHGFDISGEMIKLAKIKYKANKNLEFSSTLHGGRYEYIFMTDVIEHLEDVNSTIAQIAQIMAKDTVFINTMANPIWEPLLLAWENMGLKMREGPHTRLRYKDIEKILNANGLKVIEHDYKLLVPIKIPFFTNFLNKHVEKLLKPLCFIEYFVAVRS
jgi:2-polyprenyl-3-methyl-5-hydroxy-6-metoxy-1,4-benzoquinol methylase